MDKAYRGYLIRHNDLNGLTWIEKDGGFICYAASLEMAKKLVDGLVD